MCMVSFVGDQARDRWTPYVNPTTFGWNNPVSREEFEALKREVEIVKDLLVVAKEYDEETGQPDCEMEEKLEVLRAMAKLVGIDLDEVFA